MGEFQPRTIFPYLESPGLQIEDIPPGEKGSCIVNLVKARLSRGLVTEVCTLDPSASEPVMKWEGALVKLWIVRRRATHVLRDFYKHERKMLQQVIEQSDADVCHANWTYEYGLAAVSQKNMPHIVSVHDHARNILKWSSKRYFALFLMTQLVFKKAKYMSAVSPYVQSYVQKHSNCAVDVVPNLLSLDVKMLAEKQYATYPQKKIHITSALSWGGLKNTQRALLSFCRIRESYPMAQYNLFGSGLENGGPAHCWAQKNGCANGVNFLGVQPYNNVLETIAGSAILFHPSLEESFGLPVAEALWLGVPVVACLQAGGVRWLLQEGKYGFLSDGMDVDSMAEGLEHMIESLSSEASRKQRERAKTEIRKMCSADTVLGRYEDMYQKVVGAF